MLQPGVAAPPLSLVDIDTDETVHKPWADGPVVLAFFKVSCPVCQMAAPKVAAFAGAGARVVAIGEDPPPALHHYRTQHGQDVTTLTEPAPYSVSAAYDLEAVPTLFLVGADGVIADAITGWSRDAWNRMAAAVGAPPVSTPDDGLRPFRPG